VQAFEAAIGKKAIREYVEMHPGEAIDTESDTNAIAEWTGYRPSTNLNDGIAKFVAWYRKYYNV
jgi:UDP-glucuronate 4-epimerase